MSDLEQRPGESDASVVARRLAPQLVDLPEGDLSLTWPVLRSGPAYLLMIGPHTKHGLCWCQPVMEPCPSGDAHFHPEHNDRSH
jgi:hypothetical protein